MSEISKCFAGLPEDIIIEKIMPYAYNLQSKSLLRDIRSFTTDYEMVKDMYEIYYSPIIFFNDIISFCHEQYGFQEHIPSLGGVEYLFYRNVIFKGKPNAYVVDYINSARKDMKWSTCRFAWGLFTPEERTRFINKFITQEDTEFEIDEWYGGQAGYTF